MVFARGILALATVASATPQVMLTHYSDAQCPCSARVPADVKLHFLDNPDFEGLVDFQQFFVGDLLKDVRKCIHGEEECVAHRHFACAQKMSGDELGGAPMPPYSQTSKWLDFEACSYGPCTNCAAILGKHCPCQTYTDFTKYDKNDIMKNCSATAGLDWQELHTCGTGDLGQSLMEASANRSNADGVTYGADGLAPYFLDGVKINTRQLIPVVCGPVPKEVQKAVCAALADKGFAPKACVSAESMV